LYGEYIMEKGNDMEWVYFVNSECLINSQ